MTTPELLEFIRIEHALGMSLSEITQLLINEGEWEMSDVAEAFHTLGLPEEAIESFSVPEKIKDSIIEPQIKNKNVDNNQNILKGDYNGNKNLPQNNNQNAPPSVKRFENISSQSLNIKNSSQIFSEDTQTSKPKPTLASPASLKGQVSRNLVRTMSTASQYAQVNKTRNTVQEHMGASVHISKLEDKNSEYSHGSHIVSKDGSPLPKPKELNGNINDIEMALSVGMEIAKDEPKPSNVAKNVIEDNKKSNFVIGPNGEIKEEKATITEQPKVESTDVFANHSQKTLEDNSLAIEKKKLEEEKAKLEEEKRKFEEYKLKLEEEKNKKVEENIKDNVDISKILKESNDLINKTNLENKEEEKNNKVEDGTNNQIDISKILKDSNELIDRINVKEREEDEKKHIEEIKKEEESQKKINENENNISYNDKKFDEKISNNVKSAIESSPYFVSEVKKVETPKEQIKLEANSETVSTISTTEVKEKDLPRVVDSIKPNESAIVAPPPSEIKEKEEKSDIQNDNKQIDTKINSASPIEPAKPTQNSIQNQNGVNNFTGQPFNPYQPYAYPLQYYVQQPQPIFVAPQQPFFVGQPQQPGFVTPNQNIGPMKITRPIADSMDEIKSVSDDVDEQAYLAQFGQAKMPEGVSRPQPSVFSPTIIYQQVVGQPQDAEPTPVIKPVVKMDVVNKKPEPLRFDIGKLRTSKKNDQTLYNSKSDEEIENKPKIQSPTINPLKQEDLADMDEKFAKKESVGSPKVPLKRTMMSDLMGAKDGALTASVLPQTIDGPNLAPDIIPNVEKKTVDDEPTPPPPPKKSSKMMLTVTLISIFTLISMGAAAYYFIILRLPSAEEVYEKAMAVALRGPAISYDSKIVVNGTSTSAEPEYLKVFVNATGTLNISTKEFKDGMHYIKANISHTGIEKPIVLGFDGSLFVQDDNVYVKQNVPSAGAVIENILGPNEWVYAPYRDLGYLFGLTTGNAVGTGEYGTITPSTSLFKLLIKNSPLDVSGNLEKINENNKVVYKIPLKVNSNKSILIGDLLSKYIRGTEAVTTGAERSEILESRYNEIEGSLYVDKLSMKPLRIELNAKFDPSKISFEGEMSLNIKFDILNQPIKVDASGKTLDEIKSQRVDESLSQSIISSDLPINTIIPVIKVALNQYNEKFGRFPVTLDDLISGGFLSKESLSSNVLSRLFYSSYVEKPIDTLSGIRCTGKNVKCNFYHLGANIEYKKSSDLNNDADFISSVINGGDSMGCRNETNYACLDYIEEKAK